MHAKKKTDGVHGKPFLRRRLVEASQCVHIPLLEIYKENNIYSLISVLSSWVPIARLMLSAREIKAEKEEQLNDNIILSEREPPSPISITKPYGSMHNIRTNKPSHKQNRANLNHS